MNCGGGLIQAITRKYTLSPIIEGIGRSRDPSRCMGLAAEIRGGCLVFDAWSLRETSVYTLEKKKLSEAVAWEQHLWKTQSWESWAALRLGSGLWS